MVDWRALEQSVDHAVIGFFDEPVRITFMLRDGAPDPDRPMIDTRGALCVEGDAIHGATVGNSASSHTRLAAGEAELFLERSVYTGPEPKVGDKVRASSRAGQPWFAVSAVSDRYSHLLGLRLGQI